MSYKINSNSDHVKVSPPAVVSYDTTPPAEPLS